MNFLLGLILFFCIISFILSLGAIIFFLRVYIKSKEEKKDVILAPQQWDSLHGSITQISSKLESLASTMGEKLVAFGGMKSDLGQLLERTSHIISYTKEIGELKLLFQPPKMQGAIGEILLERLLKDILPSGTYKMQYAIAPELRPDAVIKLQDKYIPIDSKFPLSLYSRWQQENNENEKQALYKQLIKEIKMHIESVAKYVDAGLNTYDFAFMYIPAEAIYYEVFVRQNRQDIINFATAKRVIPVSPNTFYAYLQSILYGLRGLEIEKKAEEILQHISSMREDFSKLEEHMSKGEQYLTWASRHLAFIYRIINQLSIKLDSLSKLNSSN